MTNLEKELENLFLDHPDGRDAQAFLAHYTIYSHAIDDIIDEGLNEPEVILGTFHLGLQLYSSNFYRKYQDVLYPIINLIHHTYADSVIMERSSERWQKDCADVLRSCAQELTVVIIQILGGYAARRKLSILVREHVYKQQHEDIIET